VKFSHREIPVMKTGVPCNENRFFPVWKTSQGKPCSGPVKKNKYFPQTPLPGENVPYFSLPSRRGEVSSNCDMHRGLNLRLTYS